MGEHTPARKIATMGLIFALAIAVSLIEGMIPPIIPVPGIKLGLSNIITMYCLLWIGKREALVLAVLKALFIFFVRGAIAASLSLCGGVLSVLVMIAVLRVKVAADIGIVSVLGAIAHNLGQLVLASAMLRLWVIFWYYLLVLAAAGVVTGLLTSVLFKALKTYFKFNIYTEQ